MCDGCATAAVAFWFQLDSLASSVRFVKQDGDVVGDMQMQLSDAADVRSQSREICLV